MIYVFDGSLVGLLCAVFEYFEKKPAEINLKLNSSFQPDVFSEYTTIFNDQAKADRVWYGLVDKLGKSWLRKFYCAYLSEIPEVYQTLFEFCIYIFQQAKGAEKNYGHPAVLTIAQTARKVEREKHRMEAFIRFKLIQNGIFYCGIDPDFNVLPLITKHFKDRYADQQWIIYDLKRNYGLFYDLLTVEEINFEAPKETLKQPNAQQLDVNELKYAELWKNYFKSTNIVARKNTKLHIQHVPKRYWKYLTEKQPL